MDWMNWIESNVEQLTYISGVSVEKEESGRPGDPLRRLLLDQEHVDPRRVPALDEDALEGQPHHGGRGHVDARGRRLLGVVEEAVAGVVEDACGAEDDEREGGEAAPQPVEQDEGEQGGRGERPELAHDLQRDPRHHLDEDEVGGRRRRSSRPRRRPRRHGARGAGPSGRRWRCHSLKGGVAGSSLRWVLSVITVLNQKSRFVGIATCLGQHVVCRRGHSD